MLGGPYGWVAAWGLVEQVPGSGLYDFSVTDPVYSGGKGSQSDLLLTINQVNSADAGPVRKRFPRYAGLQIFR